MLRLHKTPDLAPLQDYKTWYKEQMHATLEAANMISILFSHDVNMRSRKNFSIQCFKKNHSFVKGCIVITDHSLLPKSAWEQKKESDFPESAKTCRSEREGKIDHLSKTAAATALPRTSSIDGYLQRPLQQGRNYQLPKVHLHSRTTVISG